MLLPFWTRRRKVRPTGKHRLRTAHPAVEALEARLAPAVYGITNPDFESGLSGWQVSGVAGTYASGGLGQVAPTAGSLFALLRTDGSNTSASGFTNTNGSGTSTGTTGTLLTQSFNGRAGDTFSVNYRFLSDESTNSVYDFGRGLLLNSSGAVVATLFNADNWTTPRMTGMSSSGYNFGTPWLTSATVTLPNTSTYTLKFVLANTADTSVESALALDNVQYHPANYVPTVSLTGASSQVDEGSTAMATGTFSDNDIGQNVVITASVGTVTKTGTNEGAWNWSYDTTDGPADGQTVTITANDGVGGVSTTTFSFQVNNLPPALTPPADQAATEGTPATINLGSFTDAGANDGLWVVTVSWGDDTSDSVFSTDGVGSLGYLEHAYSDDGDYVVTVGVADKDGDLGESTFTLHVANVAPQTSILGAPATSPEGTPIELYSGEVSDPGIDDYVYLYWTVTKDGAYFDGGEGPDFTFTPDDDGTYVVTLTADDGDGGVTSDTVLIPVENLAPTVAADAAVRVVAEGGKARLTGTFSDAGKADAVTLSSDVGTVTANEDGTSWSWSYDVGDGTGLGRFVTITATDSYGAFSTTVFALVVVGLREPLDPVYVGHEARLDVEVSAPDGAAVWSAAVDFGDGTVEGLTFNDDGSLTRTFADGSRPPEQLFADEAGLYALAHAFGGEGTAKIKFAVDDGRGSATEDAADLAVLPAKAKGKVAEFRQDVLDDAHPTVRIEVSVPDDGTGGDGGQNDKVTVDADLKPGADGPMTVSVARYTAPPVEVATTRELQRKVSFDVQVGQPENGHSLTVTLQLDLVRDAAAANKLSQMRFGYIDPQTGAWKSLLNNPTIATVDLTHAADGTVKVTFTSEALLTIFSGTVFTIGLSSPTTTSIGTVRPPTAAAVGTTNGTTSDSNPALARQVSFTSSTQLSLGLTASRDSQLSVSGSAQGSEERLQGKPLATASPAQAGHHAAPEEEKSRQDDSLWAQMFNYEELLHPWLIGLDPLAAPKAPPSIRPAGDGEEQESGWFEDPVAAEQAAVREREDLSDGALAADVLEGHPALAALAAVALLAGGWRDGSAQQRRGTGERRKILPS